MLAYSVLHGIESIAGERTFRQQGLADIASQAIHAYDSTAAVEVARNCLVSAFEQPTRGKRSSASAEKPAVGVEEGSMPDSERQPA